MKGFVNVLLTQAFSWLFIINSANGEANRARGIGESCTCDNDCDFSQWLTCQNNICSCLKQKTFVYDYHQETCVVRLGEKCFEITQEYSEYNIVDLPPIVRCIDGAFCSMSSGGTCACNSYGYYESIEGAACLPKKNYAEPCTRAVECLSEVCSGVDGQCICKFGEFYHKKRKKCVGLIGAVCFGDDDCANNMICRDYDARCDCRPGYSETLFKTCEIKLNYGEPCNLTIPCNNLQLSCIDAKCDCKYFDHQIYSISSGSCKSLVGGPCTGDNDCVAFSECKAVGLFSECQCQENYLEMQNGHCMKFNRYGFPCESSSECDPIPPLVCKESKCDCRDSLKVYDFERRMCVGLAGSKCSPSSIDNNPCTENAICVQNNLQLPGKCSCTSGSRVTSERTCVLE